MKKRRYTPLQRAEALRTLHEHDDNLAHVSRLLNIPARTIYDWRKKEQSQALQDIFTPPPPQSLQNPQNPELPPIQQSAFGMTRDELIRALEIEYIPSPYEDLRQSLMMHIGKLQINISDDPDLAHIRALAVSRMLDDVLHLEPLCRLEKPPINIIKYEYQDGTYHDIPEWSNAVYSRAEQAFNAVLRQARREYYALKGETYEPTKYAAPAGQPYTEIEEPTLEELAQMPFTAEDFIPKHTGILAWFEGRKQQAQTTNPSPADFD